MRGQTKEKSEPPPGRKIGKEFTVGKHLRHKTRGAIDALDKSTRFTVCLHKTQIPSASKTIIIFPGAYEQGFALWGLLNWSVNRSEKQHFKAFGKLRSLSFSQTLRKQSPAQTALQTLVALRSLKAQRWLESFHHHS